MTANFFPAPPGPKFRLIPELQSAIVSPPDKMLWRFSGFDRDSGKPWGPIHFSERAESRWDFPGKPDVPYSGGVMCAGATFDAALGEYFARDWPGVLQEKSGHPLASRRAIFHDQLTRTNVSTLVIPADLTLLDLTAEWALSKIGYDLDAWLTSTKEYQHTRPWSKWFFECPSLDGLIYSSRIGGAHIRNYALFNRPRMEAGIKIKKTMLLPKWRVRLKAAASNLGFSIMPKPKSVAPSEDIDS